MASNNKFTFRLTHLAQQDVELIIKYITEDLANQPAAIHFKNKLETAIQEACHFPESGLPIHNDFLPDLPSRKKIIGNYIMYYYPDTSANIIYIVRIIYAKRNLTEILQALKL